MVYKLKFCFFGQILFNLARTFAVHREKSFVPTFFKFCADSLFDNLESGKRNYCFGKKSVHQFFYAILKVSWSDTSL